MWFWLVVFSFFLCLGLGLDVQRRLASGSSSPCHSFCGTGLIGLHDLTQYWYHPAGTLLKSKHLGGRGRWILIYSSRLRSETQSLYSVLVVLELTT